MAKKKSTSPANSTHVEKKAPAKTAAKASSNGSPAKKPTPAFDDEQIGLTAGAVWGVLSKSGDTTLTALKKEINSPGDLVTAAVGWLAREEKLTFDSSGRTVRISLK